MPNETWPTRSSMSTPAVAERAAFLVRFGDLRLERDDSFESGYEVGHQAAPSGRRCARRLAPGWPDRRSAGAPGDTRRVHHWRHGGHAVHVRREQGRPAASGSDRRRRTARHSRSAAAGCAACPTRRCRPSPCRRSRAGRPMHHRPGRDARAVPRRGLHRGATSPPTRWSSSPAGSREVAAGGGLLRAERHGRLHRRRRGPAQLPHGAAEAVRRARLRLLHQLRLPQGPRAGRQPVRLAALPLAPAWPARSSSPGRAARVGRDETAAYFRTRPHGSQLGAWASDAVRRGRLPRRSWTARYAELPPATRRASRCPVPPHWGGFRVVPGRVEFWQGRENRLHDRLRYVPRGPARTGGWSGSAREPQRLRRGGHARARPDTQKPAGSGPSVRRSRPDLPASLRVGDCLGLAGDRPALRRVRRRASARSHLTRPRRNHFWNTSFPVLPTA